MAAPDNNDSRLGVAIIGARAYTAGVLVELLRRHPRLRLAALQARVDKPEAIEDTFPQFRGDRSLPPVTAVDPGALDGVAVAFLCLPHTASAEMAKPLLARGIKVVDLSADFRFARRDVYEKTYGHEHPAPELIPEAVYGLPELHRAMLPFARLVANPGCYPTSVTLALAPLMQRDLVRRSSVIADCKSGVSGAGRAPSETTHFCNVAGTFFAYKIASHRHQPEMEDQLSRLAGHPVTVTFSPHLVPMDRGILATCYVELTEPMDAEALHRLYAEFYAREPFVRLLPLGLLPQTRAVWGTNFCDIALTVDAHAQRLVVTSAIDNLVKGASGQALQCANLLTGGDEADGLL